MSLTLKSNVNFTGDSSRLPASNAPLPDNATAYLDFEHGLYIIRNVSTGEVFRTSNINDLLSFSREGATTRMGPTGFIESVISGQPSFEYDMNTGERLGIRIAPAASNAAINSQDQTASNYTRSGVSVSKVAGSPDGGNNGTVITESTDNSIHALIESNWASAAGFTKLITFSIYVKMGSARYIQLAAHQGTYDVWANFDLQNGLVTRRTGYVQNADIVPAPGGYWRISMTSVMNTGTRHPTIAFINDNPLADVVPAYVGTGKTATVWGCQIESNEGPTPLLITGATTATRQIDGLAIDGETWPVFNGAAFSVFAEGITPEVYGNLQGDYEGGEALFSVDNKSSAANFVRLAVRARTVQNGTAALSSFKSSAQTYIDCGPYSYTPGSTVAFIAAVDEGTGRTWDGRHLFSGSLDLGDGFNRLLIGRSRNLDAKTYIWGGIIKRVVLYPQALTTEQMKRQFASLF